MSGVELLLAPTLFYVYDCPVDDCPRDFGVGFLLTSVF